MKLLTTLDCTIQTEKFSTENMETVEKSSNEEGGNLLAKFQATSPKTIITKEVPTVDNLEESIEIALGEEKKPRSILNVVYCEEMAHPHCFQLRRLDIR